MSYLIGADSICVQRSARRLSTFSSVPVASRDQTRRRRARARAPLAHADVCMYVSMRIYCYIYTYIYRHGGREKHIYMYVYVCISRCTGASRANCAERWCVCTEDDVCVRGAT